MAKAKSFSSEVESLSIHVENDVGRVISLLREEPSRMRTNSQNEDARTSVSVPPQKVPPQTPEQVLNIPETEGIAQNSSDQSGWSRIKSSSDGPVILENVTTRLTRETNERLTEAALRQKLAKQKPDTRQDIVEEAVRAWLERNALSH